MVGVEPTSRAYNASVLTTILHEQNSQLKKKTKFFQHKYPKHYVQFPISMNSLTANLGSQVESQRIVTTRRLYQRTIPASIKSSTKDLSLITT